MKNEKIKIITTSSLHTQTKKKKSKIITTKDLPKESHASDYESEGRGFESLRAYQTFPLIFRLFLAFVF